MSISDIFMNEHMVNLVVYGFQCAFGMYIICFILFMIAVLLSMTVYVGGIVSNILDSIIKYLKRS